MLQWLIFNRKNEENPEYRICIYVFAIFEREDFLIVAFRKESCYEIFFKTKLAPNAY